MAGVRANTIKVTTDVETGLMTATFYKTHKEVGHITSEGWNPDNGLKNKTAIREAFRAWAITQADGIGVDWNPEYQQQSWNRKHWKYETDEQVEEDAVELMRYYITNLCSKLKLTDLKITLDNIVPNNDDGLSYTEFGRYSKNGNWCSATVNLEVEATIDGTDVDFIYPITMKSGQLTKVKLTQKDIKEMLADFRTA